MGEESQIIRVDDERGEPGSETGYGRKPFLYMRRAYLGNKGTTTTTVRDTKYHIHKAKAPNITHKRTELKQPSAPHVHTINEKVGMGKTAAAASVIISFAPSTNGAPVPTSVIVNFNGAKPHVVTIPTEDLKTTQEVTDVVEAPAAPTAQHEIVPAPPVEAPKQDVVQEALQAPQAEVSADLNITAPAVEAPQASAPVQTVETVATPTPTPKAKNGSKKNGKSKSQPKEAAATAPSESPAPSSLTAEEVF